MSDEQNTNPRPHKPRRIAIRLTRNVILYYRKSAQSQTNASDHHKSNARQFYQKTKDESWKRPVEAIGVLVVFFYTLFAGYQSCQMREANRDAIDRTAKELQAYVSIIETRPDWTGHLKEPTADAGQVIRLPNSSKNPSSWYRLRLGVTFKNSGRTPASDVTSITTYTVQDTKEPPPILTCPATATSLLIRSRSVLAADGSDMRDNPPLFLEEPLFDLINNQQTKVLYVHFCISYRDIFNKKRCTEHCAVFMPFPGAFGFCSHGNSMDECTADYGG